MKDVSAKTSGLGLGTLFGGIAVALLVNHLITFQQFFGFVALALLALTVLWVVVRAIAKLFARYPVQILRGLATTVAVALGCGIGCYLFDVSLRTMLLGYLLAACLYHLIATAVASGIRRARN